MDSETESNYAQNGKVILASTTLLFLLLLIVIFLHTFRHTCFRRRRNNHHRHRHSHRVPTNSAAAFNKGLHPNLLSSLPTFVHSSSSAAAAGDSCAVCMSEFAAGDEGRALPSCRHAFHSQCIDAWLRSHSNCPVCRTPVQLPVRPGLAGSDDVEPGPVSWSAFPDPVWCPRKPLELEEEKLKKSYCVNITITPHM